MLSYRHAFHAGNFADVFKHALLVQLIQALKVKEKPFCVLDTHAGAGRYDLESEPAQKNREFIDGVGRLWGRTDLSAQLSGYVERVQALNQPGVLRWYPGSPRIIRDCLRPDDRLILTELHPTEFPLLKAEFRGDRQVAVHHADGYSQLKAFLPPPQRRGLVLLDPAYEFKGEFERLLEAVHLIQRRWATAIIAIWYPIRERAPSLRFQQLLSKSGITGILCAELSVYPTDGPLRLRGCGMVLINPPWMLKETLDRLLTELLGCLRVTDQGETGLEWLVPSL